MIPASILAAILERRRFSWLPRAVEDRRKIEQAISIYRRINQRRK